MPNIPKKVKLGFGVVKNQGLEIKSLQGWPLNITIQIRVLEINLLGFDITNFYNHIQNGNLPTSCY